MVWFQCDDCGESLKKASIPRASGIARSRRLRSTLYAGCKLCADSLVCRSPRCRPIWPGAPRRAFPAWTAAATSTAARCRHAALTCVVTSLLKSLLCRAGSVPRCGGNATTCGRPRPGAHQLRDGAREVRAGGDQGRRVRVPGLLRRQRRRRPRARARGRGRGRHRVPGRPAALGLRLLQRDVHEPRHAARPRRGRQAQAAGALPAHRCCRATPGSALARVFSSGVKASAAASAYTLLTMLAGPTGSWRACRQARAAAKAAEGAAGGGAGTPDAATGTAEPGGRERTHAAPAAGGEGGGAAAATAKAAPTGPDAARKEKKKKTKGKAAGSLPLPAAAAGSGAPAAGRATTEEPGHARGEDRSTGAEAAPGAAPGGGADAAGGSAARGEAGPFAGKKKRKKGAAEGAAEADGRAPHPAGAAAADGAAKKRRKRAPDAAAAGPLGAPAGAPPAAGAGRPAGPDAPGGAPALANGAARHADRAVAAEGREAPQQVWPPMRRQAPASIDLLHGRPRRLCRRVTWHGDARTVRAMCRVLLGRRAECDKVEEAGRGGAARQQRQVSDEGGRPNRVDSVTLKEILCAA
jgi:hypothetical protein